MIAILIKHPNLFEATYSTLKPEDMVTDFSRKLYSRLADIYIGGSTFDLILLGDGFSPDEVGYVSKLLTASAGKADAERELADALKVISEEKEKVNEVSTDEMSDEEWAAEMRKKSKQKANR